VTTKLIVPPSAFDALDWGAARPPVRIIRTDTGSAYVGPIDRWLNGPAEDGMVPNGQLWGPLRWARTVPADAADTIIARLERHRAHHCMTYVRLTTEPVDGSDG
jgi:hypothetical protein